ncbi:MAG: N-acetyl-gamma-glutamyl-phosphate reductase [Pseudomonadota bacterium]
MSTRVFIDGAAGTTGLEIHERLKDRAEFDLIVLDDAQRKDEAARKEALHEADVAILCLPDDAAREALKLAEGSNTRIIDASSAHRVADGWTYGFPELIGHEQVANAQFVSNPGCYPTGFLALIAPLVRNGLLPAHYPFTVNAVSGYSGGGNALIGRFEGDEPEIAFRAYGLNLGHKHLPEMQRHAGLTRPPVFSPSVIHCRRGMIVDVPLHLEPETRPVSAMQDQLIDFYKDAQLVHVIPNGQGLGEILQTTDAEAYDGLTLTVCRSEDGNQARLISMLDNLGKGASGAAIQNLNIMCGLPETTGLRL